MGRSKVIVEAGWLGQFLKCEGCPLSGNCYATREDCAMTLARHGHPYIRPMTSTEKNADNLHTLVHLMKKHYMGLSIEDITMDEVISRHNWSRIAMRTKAVLDEIERT